MSLDSRRRRAGTRSRGADLPWRGPPDLGVPRRADTHPLPPPPGLNPVPGPPGRGGRTVSGVPGAWRRRGGRVDEPAGGARPLPGRAAAAVSAGRGPGPARLRRLRTGPNHLGPPRPARGTLALRQARGARRPGPARPRGRGPVANRGRLPRRPRPAAVLGVRECRPHRSPPGRSSPGRGAPTLRDRPGDEVPLSAGRIRARIGTRPTVDG